MSTNILQQGQPGQPVQPQQITVDQMLRNIAFSPNSGQTAMDILWGSLQGQLQQIIQELNDLKDRLGTVESKLAKQSPEDD